MANALVTNLTLKSPLIEQHCQRTSNVRYHGA